MPALTPHVGVRAFFDPVETAAFLVADMSAIGGVFTAPAATGKIPRGVPFAFTTDDLAVTTAIGPTGTLKWLVDACIGEGLVATVVATVVEDDADIEKLMVKACGSASARTGLWSLLDAEAETGVAPDLIIAPGVTSQRLGNAANPAATIIDALCDRIVTAIGIVDTPSSDRVAAAGYAADFAGTLNLVAIGQGARVMGPGGTPVIRPASSHVAAHIAGTDKRRGAPYYNPGNQTLKGILGPSRAVSYRINDPDCEANYLLQRGVNSFVQTVQDRTARTGDGPRGKTFWGFFNTSSNAQWRQLHMVRTRKAVLEVIPRTLAQYVGRNLGPHLVTTIGQAIEQFLGELHGLPEPAILSGWRVLWPRELNANGVLSVGGSAFRVQFQEAPALIDLQVFTEPNETSFDITAAEIAAAMTAFNVGGQLYGAL